MRRIGIIVGVLLAVLAAFFYLKQHNAQSEALNKQMFDVVMSEKMTELYQQAQDWSKPIKMEIKDPRLDGDYQVLSEFLLRYWIKNVETRHLYIRQLKAAKWDQFLDVARLDADRKQQYIETETMLKTVHQATKDYQQQNILNKKTALVQAQSLSIAVEIRDPLQEKLAQNLTVDQESSLILRELEVLNTADQMFIFLKKNAWQKQNNKILFAQDQQVKQFNQLYQKILRLNMEIEHIKKQNIQAIQQPLS